MFKEEKLSPIWRLVDWAYGRPSPLWVSGDSGYAGTILSTQGVKQGDPLASFLFALSMVDIYARSAATGGVVAVAVQDDLCFLGDPEKVISAWRALTLCLKDSGLVLEPSKSVALAGDSVRHFFVKEGIDVSSKFFLALGACISRDPQLMRLWLERRTESSHSHLFSFLQLGKLSSQAGYHILRKSAVPSMNYWSRSLPPGVFASAAAFFDGKVREIACRLFSLKSISDVAYNQLVLPIRDGGFGLTSLRLISPFAWVSALAQVSATLARCVPKGTNWRNGWLHSELTSALSTVGGVHTDALSRFPLTVDDFWVRFTVKPASKGLQKSLLLYEWRTLHKALLSTFRPKSVDHARLVGVSSKAAGTWLTSLPDHKWTRMDDMHWGMSGKLRLGLPPFDDLSWCGCGASITQDPSHFLACKRLSAQWTFRHRRLQNLLMSFAEMARIDSLIEPAVGEQRERADVLFCFSSCTTLVDLSVVHILSQTHRSKAAKSLAVAESVELDKFNKYEEKAKSEGKAFFPLIMETTGGIGRWGEHFLRLLSKEVTVDLARATFGGHPLPFFRRALCTQLQLCNANIQLRGARLARGFSCRELKRL